MKQAGSELIKFEVSVVSSAGRQAVFDVLCDLGSHLEWAGRRAASKSFRLLTLEAAQGPARVGTTFESTGANDNGTFHDASTVSEAVAPERFAFETDSRLERKHGKDWHAHFSHRYEIEPVGEGSRILYTASVAAAPGSYVPYWLRPGVRRLTRVMVNRMIARQLANLAALSAEREHLAVRGEGSLT